MSKITLNQEYKNWFLELKQQFRQSQLKAVVKVNSELLQSYWYLESNIVQRQL